MAVRIKRADWERALNEAVLTHPEKRVYKSADAWRAKFKHSRVHVQWDPERSIRGNKQDAYSIQVGISRHLIRDFVTSWIVSITDMTPQVKKMHTLIKKGDYDKAKRHLPDERVYPLPDDIGAKLGMN